MKIIFIGSIKFSEECLKKILSLKGSIAGVVTLKNSKFNSDHTNLSVTSKKNGIPYKFAEDANSSDIVKWIKKKKPDIIFCFGWSKLLKKQILEIPPMGVLGYHPAALPQNRGRHPLIWALVLGLKETASTFFFMDEGADSGEILSQKKVKILKEDDAGILYKKITRVALRQIEDFLPKLRSKNFKLISQDHNNANYWRKRNSKDGLIDWRMSAISIHNLVRALTHPYIGAHFVYKNCEIKVWKTQILKSNLMNIEPGKVISSEGEELVVQTGEGLIKIVHISSGLKINIGEYL